MTRWTKLLTVVAAGAVLWTGAVTLRADDKDSADSSAQKEDKPAKKSRKLVQPWSAIASLSDEQKQQIGEIHQRINDEKKKLDEQEREEILALLSDEQKAEAKKIEEDKKMSAKVKSGEKEGKTSAE